MVFLFRLAVTPHDVLCSRRPIDGVLFGDIVPVGINSEVHAIMRVCSDGRLAATRWRSYRRRSPGRGCTVRIDQTVVIHGAHS